MTPQPARPALVLARAVAARACRGVVIDSLDADRQRRADERSDAGVLAYVSWLVDSLLRDNVDDDRELVRNAARATWELLPEFDLIGREWLDDARRRFVHVIHGRVRMGTLDIQGAHMLAPHPPTVRGCIAFAADAGSVLAAEQITRARHGDRTAVWRFVPPDELGTTPVVGLDGVERGRSRQGLQLGCPDVETLGYAIEQCSWPDSIGLLCPLPAPGRPL